MRYVTSVEYPFYLQVNDVIIKRSSISDSLVDSKQTIDSWEECESLSYFPMTSSEDVCGCKLEKSLFGENELLSMTEILSD
jgi:hypothetical protein